MFTVKTVQAIKWWAICLRHIATSSHRRKAGCSGCDLKPGDIRDKAALVTGGASGIGLQCCKALLRCGARGVTIADKDDDSGDLALKQLAEEFGNERALFVHCDVTKSELVDWAFKTTINAFNRLDIVINSAGVLNDQVWENEIHTNVCGTMVASLLGLQYMAAHCIGTGGFVINIASTMGLTPFGGAPIYSMTQSAILGLTRALGQGSHLDRTKVKVIGLAVGLTETPLMINATQNAINTRFSEDFIKDLGSHKWQQPEVVAHTVLQAIQDGEAGAVWIVESGSKPYKICIPGYHEMKQIGGTETVIKCEIPCPKPKKKCNEPEDTISTESSSDKYKQRERRREKRHHKQEAKGGGGKPPPKEEPKRPPPTKSTKSVRIHGKCGTCPEPKWHGNGEPLKKKKKEVKVDDRCDSCEVELNYSRNKQSRINYTGRCSKSDSDKKLGAKKSGKKTAPAPTRPPPKGGKVPPPKRGNGRKGDSHSMKSEMSFECECDLKTAEEDCCKKGKSRMKTD